MSDGRRCAACSRWFKPRPQTRQRQRFCTKARCRTASKADSQRRWLAKPVNRDYWRGPAHVTRVRAWRATKPRYWRR